MRINKTIGYIKRVRWVQVVNSRWKAYWTKSRWRSTRRYYGKIPPLDIVPQFLRDIRDKPTIFFLGTDELQDRSGILQALERLGNAYHFTRADGAYGQNHPGTPGERRASNTARLLELFAVLSKAGNTPDILIAQTWGSYIDPAAFSQIRTMYKTAIVSIAMDDRHQYWGGRIGSGDGGTHALIPHIDLALTAAPECVEWYLKERCPALFFPEASDPSIFHPMPELPKIHDVCFVGARYGIREEIVLALRKAGITVAAYGQGWEGGRIATGDVPKLFAQSKIILGVGTIGHCSDFYALKMRDFDGPMSGSLYLTHDNPDLHLLYESGKEIATYRSIDECVEKASYYLKHGDERERIAMAGYERAVKEHTWDMRFGMLFDLLGGRSV